MSSIYEGARRSQLNGEAASEGTKGQLKAESCGSEAVNGVKRCTLFAIHSVYEYPIATTQGLERSETEYSTLVSICLS